MTRPFITFTSDFSLQDDSVGAVKGVMWRIVPDAVIVDILHTVPDYRRVERRAHPGEYAALHGGGGSSGRR